MPGGDGRFGNRFATPFLPRGSIILTHRMWFLTEMNRVPNVFRDAVHALLDLPRPDGVLRLGCFCKQPGSQVSCHGDVIAEYLNSMEIQR